MLGHPPATKTQFLLFPQEHGLDFQRLLDASAYKELYRQDMIRWGEERRHADPGFFCRMAVAGAVQPVWVSWGVRGGPGARGGH